VNRLNMYYEMHGNTGEYLVLIHGGGSTIGTSFGTILPMLAPNHKVIAVELQAHGHTSDRNTPESFEQDADDVAALLHNLQISKASFFGFSNGGNTAMQIAIRHPELVNKLVIASAFYKREGMFPGFFDMMKGATINDMPQLLKDAYLKINPDTNGLMAMFTKDRDRMINFKDWPDEMLRSIKAPSLILSGDRDVASNRHTVEMAGLIEGSRLVILPAAHGAYIGVAESPDPGSKLPEMTVQIVDEFLKKQ
jgi:pimeloyl-ACP methyl ester carboxylesterase